MRWIQKSRSGSPERHTAPKMYTVISAPEPRAGNPRARSPSIGSDRTVAIIGYTAGSLADLDRLCDCLADSDPVFGERAIELIASAAAVLYQHPPIGRPVESGLRELVISRGRSGYLALYRYDEDGDRVLVLSIRHQREAGYVG